MRRLRWLLPVAILAILSSVGAIYWQQRKFIGNNPPKPPTLLPSDTKVQALDWCWQQVQGDNPHVKICSTKMKSVGDHNYLEGVKLYLYHQDAKKFDFVTSDLADFDQTQRVLHSEGNVAITLAIPTPPDGEPESADPAPGRLLKIHSSGVDFSSETGEASTTRDVTFEFDRGSGSATGAHYVPGSHQLKMESNVKLDWFGKPQAAAAGSPPMHIEAGQAWYFEDQSKVVLMPWAKLSRGTLHMDAANTEVILKNGDVEHVDASMGSGTQETAARKVEFGAKDLHLYFDEHMNVRYILAAPEAHLVSTAATTRTTVTGDRMDMNFVARDKDSVLTSAHATGKGSVTSEPVQRAGVTPPETRVLRSEVIHVLMRPSGDDIEHVETDGAGTLDFLPNRPDQVKRNLKGDRFWIYYAADNRIEHFRTVNATTRSETKPPRNTASKELLAYFDNAGVLARMEQNTDFTYDEGDRRSSSRKATLDQTKDLITLDGGATSSDPTGRVNADRITLTQKTNDYTAEGSVSTTRQPTHKGGNSAMLSNDEVMQATAKRMTSTQNGQRIHYEGDAKAWQGANRVTADRIDIDQQTHIMEAHGHVETQFADKASPKNAGGPPPFTVVHAQDMEYNTETRIAHYRGGTHLDRPGLTVDGRELTAYLKDSGTSQTPADPNKDSGSSLDKAFVDGAAKIVSTTAVGRGKRVRTGTSEHAEYYADDQKVILNQGQPRLEDTETGTTTGRELTWWANNDRLLVDGTEKQPVRTTIYRKK